MTSGARSFWFLLDPKQRTLRSLQAWKIRGSVLLAAVRGRDRYRDADGSLIHHAGPGTVVAEVERAAGLRSAGVWATRSGRPGVAARAFSAWPTYLFRSPR